MLIEKEIRYAKRTECSPVCQYLYANIYLQQWHRFIAPNITHYGDLYLSARGTGITFTVDHYGKKRQCLRRLGFASQDLDSQKICQVVLICMLIFSCWELVSPKQLYLPRFFFNLFVNVAFAPFVNFRAIFFFSCNGRI